MPERIETQLTLGGLEGPIVSYDTTGINAVPSPLPLPHRKSKPDKQYKIFQK